MAVWSSLATKQIEKLSVPFRLINSLKTGQKGKGLSFIPVRKSSHDRTIPLKPSLYEAFKFKDYAFFYLTIGLIPVVAIALYCNIFIGPATLALIPEGYTPKEYEYHRHPITRFFAKYFTLGKQEAYERTMHNLFFKYELGEIRQLEKKIRKLMREREDYQAWFFDKVSVKYGRKYGKDLEKTVDQSQRRSGWVE